MTFTTANGLSDSSVAQIIKFSVNVSVYYALFFIYKHSAFELHHPQCFCQISEKNMCSTLADIKKTVKRAEIRNGTHKDCNVLIDLH